MLEEASVTVDAVTGKLEEASSRAEELLLQKKAEAQEVVSQLSEFAASARKPPSDEVKKMLSEDGFSPEDPESSCASNGRSAVRCIAWNFAVTLDMGNHSSTDAVGLRASVKTPGIPALEMALLHRRDRVRERRKRQPQRVSSHRASGLHHQRTDRCRHQDRHNDRSFWTGCGVCRRGLG